MRKGNEMPLVIHCLSSVLPCAQILTLRVFPPLCCNELKGNDVHAVFQCLSVFLFTLSCSFSSFPVPPPRTSYFQSPELKGNDIPLVFHCLSLLCGTLCIDESCLGIMVPDSVWDETQWTACEFSMSVIIIPGWAYLSSVIFFYPYAPVPKFYIHNLFPNSITYYRIWNSIQNFNLTYFYHKKEGVILIWHTVYSDLKKRVQLLSWGRCTTTITG